MNNNKEQAPVPKKETPEERDERIAGEVQDIFKEEGDRGVRDFESTKKPESE